MIKILEKNNEKIDLACILDIAVAQAPAPPEQRVAVMVEILKKLLASKPSVTKEDYVELMKKISVIRYTSLAKVIRQIKDIVIDIVDFDSETEFLLRMFGVQAHNLANDYVTTGQIETKLILINAEENNHIGSENLGWSNHASVSVFKSEGDHYQMTKGQNANLVAKIIKEIISNINIPSSTIEHI
jgi:hypothetical protein